MLNFRYIYIYIWHILTNLMGSYSHSFEILNIRTRYRPKNYRYFRDPYLKTYKYLLEMFKTRMIRTRKEPAWNQPEDPNAQAYPRSIAALWYTGLKLFKTNLFLRFQNLEKYSAMRFYYAKCIFFYFFWKVHFFLS